MPAGVAARVAGYRLAHGGLPGFTAGTVDPPPTVTFPITPLNARVYIALGADLTQLPSTWVWEDITAYVRFASGVSMSTGRQDQTSHVQTGSASLTLDNRDGRFNRRNAAGPYFGKLTLNTPIWGTIDAGSGTYTRLAMFVNEWPARSDRSGTDITVSIQCAGILRRLGQGTVTKSPLRRSLAAASPVLYWPLEDGTAATQAASGLPVNQAASGITGGMPLTSPRTGTVFSAIGTCTGSANYASYTTPVTPDTGMWPTINLQPYALGSTQISVAYTFSASFAPTPAPTAWNAVSIVTDAGTVLATLTYAGYSGGVRTSTYGIDIDPGAAGGTTFGSGFDPFDGKSHSVLATWTQVGADIHETLVVDGTKYTATKTSTTLGNPLTLNIASAPIGTLDGIAINNANATIGIGHYAVWGSGTPLDPHQAAIGYLGETATARVGRVCTEDGIPLVFAGSAAASPVMGVQPIADTVDILRDAEAVDGGVLYEAMNWGFGFQSIRERENAPVLLALDFNQGHIATEPSPADDDQRIRNRWVVTRQTPTNSATQGTSYTAQATTGSMGIQAGGPGIYDDSATVNVQLDTGVPDQAGWRLHLGQVDADRWENLPLRLHGTPALIDAWCRLPYGARMTAANPPDMGATDTIDAVIEGWTERWDTESWDVDPLITSPFQPYRVSQLDDIVLGKLDTAGCQVVTALGTADTTLTAYTTVEPVWTADATQVPFDVNMTGERVTFANITSRLKDTFNRTVSSSWGTADTGNAYSNQGGVNSDYGVAPGGGTHSLGSVNVMRSTFTLADDLTACSALASWTIPVVATGAFIAASAVLRGDFFAGVQYQYSLRFNTDGTVTGAITRVTGAGTVDLVTATLPGGYGAGSKWWLRCYVNSTTLQMRGWRDGFAEPWIWQLVGSDTAISHGLPGIRTILASGNTNTLPVVITTNSWEVYNPQTITLARSVNGVSKSHSAGESLSLWTPIPLGL